MVLFMPFSVVESIWPFDKCAGLIFVKCETYKFGIRQA